MAKLKTLKWWQIALIVVVLAVLAIGFVFVVLTGVSIVNQNNELKATLAAQQPAGDDITYTNLTPAPATLPPPTPLPVVPQGVVVAGAVPFVFPTGYVVNRVSLPGSFNSELGCKAQLFDGDWEPGCGAITMQVGGVPGTYAFTTTQIPAGSWEVKVATNGTWDVNAGADGLQDGLNIGFTVPSAGSTVAFLWMPANDGRLYVYVNNQLQYPNSTVSSQAVVAQPTPLPLIVTEDVSVTSTPSTLTLNCGYSELPYGDTEGKYLELNLMQGVNQGAGHVADFWWTGKFDVSGAGVARVGTEGNGNTQIIFAFPPDVYAELHITGAESGTSFRHCDKTGTQIYENAEDYALTKIWNTALPSEGLNVWVAEFPDALSNANIRKLVTCVTVWPGTSYSSYGLPACSRNP